MVAIIGITHTRSWFPFLQAPQQTFRHGRQHRSLEANVAALSDSMESKMTGFFLSNFAVRSHALASLALRLIPYQIQPILVTVTSFALHRARASTAGDPILGLTGNIPLIFPISHRGMTLSLGVQSRVVLRLLLHISASASAYCLFPLGWRAPPMVPVDELLTINTALGGFYSCFLPRVWPL